jgi:phosphopantetheine adenylyltransferase
MVIGITGDEMLKKKSNPGMISSYSQRAKNVVDFLQLVKPSLRYEPVEIQDPFGPTITDATIQAIVVSSETVPGANKINQLRSESGMPPLAIFVSRRSEGATLSSTFLRAKQMS